MAFTEEQEEILKRIIEAFQNGKTIADLPSFSTTGKNAYDLPIETIMPDASGRSGRIRAGELNKVLNAADKEAVNSALATLKEKAEFAERPKISVECFDGALKVANFEWYKNRGYGLYLFRNIKSRNRIGEAEDGNRRDCNYYNNWRPKGVGDNSEGKGKRDRYEIFSLDEDGLLLKNRAAVSTESLIDYRTFVGWDSKTYLKAKWGRNGKKIDISRTHATLTFELGLAFGEIYQAGETQRLRVEDMVSNLAKFKIMVIWSEYNDIGKWTFQFKL